MPASSVTAAQGFKGALYDAMTTLVAGTDVLVSFGHPGRDIANFDDQVAFADTDAEQAPATLGTNRSREETLTQIVHFSSYRHGGPEQEQICSARAYELLGLLEHYVRQTDTTLGGAVRQCFLTSHTCSGETDQDVLASGRLIEIRAVFTAQVRVTGP